MKFMQVNVFLGTSVESFLQTVFLREMGQKYSPTNSTAKQHR